MILTCPDCATSYFVDDGSVPPQGRTVKCSNCGARWRASPEPEAAPALEFPEPVVEAAAVEPEPVAEPSPLDDLDIIHAPINPKRAVAKTRRKLGKGAIFAGFGLAASVALVVGALVFRNEIVRLLPASERVFAALGVPVDPLGLQIEQVQFQATFQGGRPVLAITGAIHNVRDHTINAPALRITLLDKDGHPLAAKLARPLNAAVPAGGKRYFALNFADPPAGVDDPKIEFETAVPAAAHASDASTNAHQPEEAVLTPEPVEAKPLPPGSPDSIPTHG
jgi:predicted Zn finger-like uncharacterized protein